MDFNKKCDNFINNITIIRWFYKLKNTLDF